MDKKEALEKIAKQIEQCRECKIGKSGLAVVGEGNPDADVVFLGEAPGKNEAKTGRPFIGRSGALLRKFIHDIGLVESEVYIASPVKYLPDRGTPTKKDIQHGRKHLNDQLAVIDPKIIVLLGATAAYAIFERVVPIMKEHGSIVKQNNRTYLLTLHPAAVLRFPKYASLMKEDLKKVSRLIKGL
jgi:uracil-DNA glycosylase family 4